MSQAGSTNEHGDDTGLLAPFWGQGGVAKSPLLGFGVEWVALSPVSVIILLYIIKSFKGENLREKTF